MVKIDTSEITHLLVSVVTLSLAFSFYSLGAFPVVLLTMGLGFLVHELGHRTVAKMFGAQATYIAWTNGLMLAVLMAVISGGRFLFAAPGSVYIYGKNLSKMENGVVALSGPLLNMLLAVIFFISTDFSFSYYGFRINAFLGTFNLLPFHPLDGAKVFEWSQALWLIAFVVGGVLLVL